MTVAWRVEAARRRRPILTVHPFLFVSRTSREEVAKRRGIGGGKAGAIAPGRGRGDFSLARGKQPARFLYLRRVSSSRRFKLITSRFPRPRRLIAAAEPASGNTSETLGESRRGDFPLASVSTRRTRFDHWNRIGFTGFVGSRLFP